MASKRTENFTKKPSKISVDVSEDEKAKEKEKEQDPYSNDFILGKRFVMGKIP